MNGWAFYNSAGELLSGHEGAWKFYDASGETLGGGGASDHGALAGLADDDHTQYVLRSILTTDGDIFVRSGGVISRLGIGSNGDVLSVSGGAPLWSTPGGGSAHNILSTAHADVDAADTPADGDVLTWVEADSQWKAVPGGGGGSGESFHPFLLMGA